MAVVQLNWNSRNFLAACVCFLACTAGLARAVAQEAQTSSSVDQTQQTATDKDAESQESGDDGGSETDAAPVTTAEPTISVENLEILLLPLTRSELQTEAEAWRELLKDCARRIAKVRITELQAEEADSEAEATGSASDGNEVEGDSATAQDADSDALTSADENTGDEAVDQADDDLADLLEEKIRLVKRLSAVLTQWEAKGGDAEELRQYASALQGLGVDVGDASTLLSVVSSWLVSEEGGQRWFWNLLKFLAIILAFYFSASIVARFVGRAVRRFSSSSQLLIHFLEGFIRQFFVVIGLLIALSALEVDITPLLAALGAAGFVIGFALQDTLSNFASGLLILAYRPFDVGHFIDAAGVTGTVDSVSLFSTKVRTVDNKVMIVPNNDIWGGTITNASASPTRRVDMVFGIGYDDDIARAAGLLEEIVAQHPKVLKDPEPTIQLNELADSSVNFVCRPWTNTDDYWAVYWDITRTVKERFDDAGISIPYPQQDVHLHRIES